MNETSKPGFTIWVLLFLWPIASMVTLLAFFSNGPVYNYSQEFDSMVATKYVLTIIGHISAFIAIPVLLLVIISRRKIKSTTLFSALITVTALVLCMQLFFRFSSLECIGEGCRSENLSEEFSFPLSYLTGVILLVLSVLLGFISKKKLSL